MIKITLGWLAACAILVGIAYTAKPADAMQCYTTYYKGGATTNCY